MDSGEREKQVLDDWARRLNQQLAGKVDLAKRPFTTPSTSSCSPCPSACSLSPPCPSPLQDTGTSVH